MSDKAVVVNGCWFRGNFVWIGTYSKYGKMVSVIPYLLEYKRITLDLRWGCPVEKRNSLSLLIALVWSWWGKITS